MGRTLPLADVEGATSSLRTTWRVVWMLCAAPRAPSASECCTTWQPRVEMRRKKCEGEVLLMREIKSRREVCVDDVKLPANLDAMK